MELSPLDRISEGDRKRKRGRRLGWALAVLMFLVFVGDRVIDGKRGERYHQQLLDEFSAITPLPNASVVATLDNFSPWNSHKALVGAKYSTNLPYADVREFYSRELESRGWHLAEDHPFRGGHELTYCKEGLAASLEYGGGRGWTYGLDLTWGLHRCN